MYYISAKKTNSNRYTIIEVKANLAIHQYFTYQLLVATELAIEAGPKLIPPVEY